MNIQSVLLLLCLVFLKITHAASTPLAPGNMGGTFSQFTLSSDILPGPNICQISHIKEIRDQKLNEAQLTINGEIINDLKINCEKSTIIIFDESLFKKQDVRKFRYPHATCTYDEVDYICSEFHFSLNTKTHCYFKCNGTAVGDYSFDEATTLLHVRGGSSIPYCVQQMKKNPSQIITKFCEWAYQGKAEDEKNDIPPPRAAYYSGVYGSALSTIYAKDSESKEDNLSEKKQAAQEHKDESTSDEFEEQNEIFEFF